jgi:starch phosphorylase
VHEVDEHDYRALFELLERKVVPEYYDRDADGLPRAWIRRMKESLIKAGRVFTTGRMVQEYTTRYYVPALEGRMKEDDPPVFDEPVFIGDAPSLVGNGADG